MTWYVEAVAAPLLVAASPAELRDAIDDHIAHNLGGTAPHGPTFGRGAAAETLFRLDGGIWATVSIDIAPAGRAGSRIVVRGCFWGDLADPAIGAATRAERTACQAVVDSSARDLGTHLRDSLRARLSGTELD